MARGDQIYVIRPFMGLHSVYEHHGIDCGDGTVIHYSKAEEVATIRRTTLAHLTLGNPIHIKTYKTSFIPTVVIDRAESRLGEQRYNLISNNCEHFATWCKTGVSHSQQIEDYGLGLGQIRASDSEKLVHEAAETGDIDQAIALFNHATQNVAIAQHQLQSQYDHLLHEVHDWHRVALAALRRSEEHLARAAIERKLKYQRQAHQLKAQLDQLATMQVDLNRNREILDQRIVK
jgi:hypothetical protein